MGGKIQKKNCKLSEDKHFKTFASIRSISPHYYSLFTCTLCVHPETKCLQALICRCKNAKRCSPRFKNLPPTAISRIPSLL